MGDHAPYFTWNCDDSELCDSIPEMLSAVQPPEFNKTFWDYQWDGECCEPGNGAVQCLDHGIGSWADSIASPDIDPWYPPSVVSPGYSVSHNDYLLLPCAHRNTRRLSLSRENTSTEYQQDSNLLSSALSVGTSVMCTVLGVGSALESASQSCPTEFNGRYLSGRSCSRLENMWRDVTHHIFSHTDHVTDSGPMRTIIPTITFTTAILGLYHSNNEDRQQDRYLLGGITTGVVVGLALERDLERAILRVIPLIVVLTLFVSRFMHQFYHGRARIMLQPREGSWSSKEKSVSRGHGDTT